MAAAAAADTVPGVHLSPAPDAAAEIADGVARWLSLTAERTGDPATARRLDLPGAGPALDLSLRQLAAEDPPGGPGGRAQSFGGLAVPEIAGALGVSEPTIQRDRVFARARLAQLLA